MFFSFAFLKSGEYMRFFLMKLMSNFSFLRAELSVKVRVRMDSKLIGFEIKRGTKVH
jgi:hypothetical protein